MARRSGSRGGSRRKRGVRRHEFRRRLLLLSLILAASVLVARSFQLSIMEHARWLDRAEAQQADTLSVPAARGTIFDRDGVPLAASRAAWIIGVAPQEIEDKAAAIDLLVRHADLSRRRARNIVTDEDDPWHRLPGRYGETTRTALDGIDGIYFESTSLRFYPHGGLAGEVLGHVNLSGDVAGGIEQQLDSLLTGTDGLSVAQIDNLGHQVPGAMVRITEPKPGLDVVLTLDADLQEIASDALTDALEETGASSGEMLIAEPFTGEILAAVSRRRNGPSRTWTAVIAPYEPGSTIKPFTVGSLLTEGAASLHDSIYAEEGSYRLHGRTIRDVTKHGWLTLREGFLESSNIVMAKAASRLTRAQQYQRLRDLGFGVPTGVPYPSESGGRLSKLGRWSKQTQASLAYGYELLVTPLQLVMAYCAIANGGILMEPRLIRDIRARDGRILQSFEPRAVRRALPQSVAAVLRELLAEAVVSGTGQNASMGGWKVAGKTGTAKIVEGGRYISEYIATFAGFFPAESPQLVFLVKLDRPKGDRYYGGLTAAPVTRATLEAALAAHGTPIDRSAVSTVATSDTRPPVVVESFADPVQAVPALLELDGPSAGQPVGETGVIIPDVTGLSLRHAVKALHTAGFRVHAEGSGLVRSTRPRAGEQSVPGTTVRVIGGDRR